LSKIRRKTLPPTGTYTRICKNELKREIAKGCMQMDQCIEEGRIPLFGYPLVCHSPIE